MCVASSHWPPSRTSVHLHFRHVFLWLHSSFIFIAEAPVSPACIEKRCDPPDTVTFPQLHGYTQNFPCCPQAQETGVPAIVWGRERRCHMPQPHSCYPDSRTQARCYGCSKSLSICSTRILVRKAESQALPWPPHPSLTLNETWCASGNLRSTLRWEHQPLPFADARTRELVRTWGISASMHISSHTQH